MICPKCGAEISDNAGRCGNCGLKVTIRCPECNTINKFGDKFCKNCGFDFLISCPACGSTNIYLAKECRKCHTILRPQKNSNYQKKNNNNEFEVVNAFSSDESAYKTPAAFTQNDDDVKETKEIIQPEDGGIPYAEDNIKSEEQYFKVETGAVDEELKIIEEQEPEDIVAAQANIINLPEEQTSDEVSDKNNIEIESIPSENNTDKEEELVKIADEAVSSDNVINDEKDLESIFDDNEPDFVLEPENNADIEEVKEESIKQSPNNGEFTDFEDTEIPINIQPETVEKVVNILTASLKKHVVAINGPEGSGKTAILNQVSSELSQKGYVSLYGSCTPLIQITSFGFFQDALLRMMGFPPYTNNTDAFAKDFKKSGFSKIFSSLNQTELNAFLNIFYPSQKDVFENILDNKKKMFSVLEKVIKSFLSDNNLIIIIDNFELLDGASYDFIMHILKKGFFNNRVKLLTAYKENKSIQSYFDLTAEEDRIFETVLIQKMPKRDIIEAVSNSFMFNIEDVLNADYLNELINKADGNAIRLEQEIALLTDTGYISVEDNKIFVHEDRHPEIKPATFEELIKLRLNALTPAAKNVLYMASIMGFRFATGVLCQSAGLQPEKAAEVLGYLIQQMYIKQVDNYTCEFKNLTLWKLIYQEAKEDLLYKENSEKLYQTLRQLTLSSNLQKVISCTEALTKNEAFLIWQNTASITAKLGDTNLYVIAQKQCLKILEEQDMDDSEEIKAQIYEEIGKLLCEKSPKEAITYLANVLDADIKDKNIRKIIDISGYFVKSCYLSGNYFGVTEAVDTVVKQLENTQNVTDIDIALVKTRKLRALLNIGNSEQIINIANEDIIPELNRHIEASQNDAQYKSLLINAWLLTKITLAKAYGIQGNIAINNVVTEIRHFIDKYANNSDYYLVQTDIIEAFAKTVTGDINQSNEILNHISNEYKDRKMETNLLAEWNLINIINRVLSGQNADLKIDLFELAAFTNNINEHFIKNIVKLILGNVLKEEGDTKKALEIFNEEITYFAKEKVAIGALLAWALIVKLSLETGDELKAMDVSAKSLDIAKSPKINNYFFIIYFKRILAKLYIQRNDLEAAKMYLEESLIMAKQFGLKYQLVELYIDYAQYTEEVMKAKHIYSQTNLNTTFELYNKAVASAKELKLPNLSDKAYKARAGFKTFCQLNNLEFNTQ